jgi:ADP-heptose:LPS heptosyltransferase
MYLFPFESIEKGSNIVLYGAGRVGFEYVLQNSLAGYCNIMAVLDQRHDEKKNFPLPVQNPETITNIREYDLVVVALATQRYCEEAQSYLACLGVPADKILVTGSRLVETEQMIVIECDPAYREEDMDVFSLAVIGLGGLGDALITSSFIKEARKTFRLPVRIDFYCGPHEIFRDSPFIDNVRPLDAFRSGNSYDAAIVIRRFSTFRNINLKKLQRFSPLLHKYCLDSIRMIKDVFQDSINDFQFTKYALLKGKNRLEQCNVNGILPYDRDTPTYLDWGESGFDILTRHNLDDRGYLVVCNSVESKQSCDHPKLWPNDYFEILLGMLKRAYPDLLLVHVGENDRFGRLKNIDLDLLGQTTLDELKVVMKHALLTIAVEGGILHLAHFLNGRAVGLFGPTTPKVFGYAENSNLRRDDLVPCDDGCEWVTNSWLHECAIGSAPKCMELLRPGYVFSAIADLLDGRRRERFRVEAALDASGDGLAAGISGIFRNLAGAGARVAHIDRRGEELMLVHAAEVEGILVFTRHPEASAAYRPRTGFPGRIEAEYGNIHNIPARDDTYDLTSNFTLMESRRPDLALREMARITRPGGRILVRLTRSAAADEGGSRLAAMLGDSVNAGGDLLLCIGKE